MLADHARGWGGGIETVNYWKQVGIKSLLSQLLRRRLPVVEGDVVYLLGLLREQHKWADLPLASLLGLAERWAREHRFSASIDSALKGLRKLVRKWSDYADYANAAARIDAILGGKAEVKLEPGDAWADRALKDIQAMDSRKAEAWRDLVAYCGAAKGSKPSGKWLRSARPLLDAVGVDGFVTRTPGWFALVGARGNRSRIAGALARVVDPEAYLDANLLLTDTNAGILRGLAWCCSGMDDVELARSVGDMAEAAFKKIPGYGSRSVKVGNACLVALASMPGNEPVAQLTRLRARVKQPSARAQVEKALAAVSERTGMSADELEELSAPTFGMKEAGVLETAFGEHSAVLRVTGTTSTELRWRKPGGGEQKSVPVAAKEGFPEELRALKRTAKEIQKTLPAQRNRIERTYLRTRELGLPSLRKHYLEHPLVATLARRLIWQFRRGERVGTGIWHDGGLVDARDGELDWIDDGTLATLWHPIGSAVEDVMAWREWLEAHGVRQPFKQAHREVYILTDAERETDVYSNRFASHIIRQHQFAALCRERNWRYTLQGGFDSHNVPALSLPEWNMQAEFWVEAMWDGQADGEMSGAGILLTVTTDQVRFLDPRGELVRLADVPPIVFSEVMRDVDLFVGVCSIGNDPAWGDRGVNTYWHSYSFGDLSANAKTRKEVLERVVPKLRIADRCSFLDRFLVVKGDLRTYRIHLGSGNVLMEPNDQYLCIVRGRGKALEGKGQQKLYLPFEGDGTLALILSKAFLLAEDARIKDPTIVSQINRRR